MRRHFEVARPGGKTHTLFLAVGTWWFFLLSFLLSVPVPGGLWGLVLPGLWSLRRDVFLCDLWLRFLREPYYGAWLRTQTTRLR